MQFPSVNPALQRSPRQESQTESHSTLATQSPRFLQSVKHLLSGESHPIVAQLEVAHAHPVESASRNPQQPIAGKHWKRVLRPSSLADHEPFVVNLSDTVGWRTNAAAYCLAYVRSDHPQTVTLSLGSDDGCKVWLNGKVVHSNLTQLQAHTATPHTTTRGSE